jgi:dipeptidyl aminopeptidase/acylaminoacyl peptidase
MGRLLASVAIVTVMIAAPAPADAAYPGQNGRLAFVAGMSTEPKIFSVNPDGSDLRQLTTGPFDRAPRWSPDGSHIAFTRFVSGHSGLYVMNAEGGGLHLVTDELDYQFGPTWSPDGTEIAFTGQAGDEDWSEVYVVRTDGTDLRDLTNDASIDDGPAWAPDGSKIAFASSRTGDVEVFLMSPDGSNPTNLTRSPHTYDSLAQWTPDSSRIFFFKSFGPFGWHSIRPDGTDLMQLPPGNPGGLLSPDGSRFALALNGRVATIAADGSDVRYVTGVVAGLGAIDWQPVPNRAPDCTTVTASPSSLWPPNSKLVTVSLAGATDPDGDSVTVSATGVTSDEPGAGDFALGPGSAQVRLRAKRNGATDGRIYTIAFEASDGRGGRCTGTASVTVPHSR